MFKSQVRIMCAVFLLVGVVSLSACGKTVMELRADGGAIVDNGSSLLKKIMDAGVAVYDLVKKVVDDGKDNVTVIKQVVTPK